MLRTQLLMVLMVCCCRSTHADCSPAEEGKPAQLTCAIDIERMRYYDNLYWFADQRILGECHGDYCGTFSDELSANITSTFPTVYIDNVSRNMSIDIEVEWSCQIRSYYEPTMIRVYACSKLEVYAKPENPTCVLSEDSGPDGIPRVNMSCSTDKVYPEAQCRFEQLTDGGNPVEINGAVNYRHVDTGETPVYYRSECWVSVPVGDLGEGTHSFLGYIYPDVTGGENLVDAMTMVRTQLDPDSGQGVLDDDDPVMRNMNSSSDDDSSNVAPIVIGVIAAVIIAVMAGVIVFLLYRLRRREATKHSTETAEGKAIQRDEVPNSDPIVTSSQGRVYHTIGDLQAGATDAPSTPSQTRPGTTTTTTISAMSRPYNTLSHEEREPPNIYVRPTMEPFASTSPQPSTESVYNNSAYSNALENPENGQESSVYDFPRGPQ